MNGFGENDTSPRGQEGSCFQGGEKESEQEETKRKKTTKASSSYHSLLEEEEQEEMKKRKRYDDWLRRNLELEGGYNIMKILYSYLVHSHGCATVDPAKLRKPPYGRVNTAAARVRKKGRWTFLRNASLVAFV